MDSKNRLIHYARRISNVFSSGNKYISKSYTHSEPPTAVQATLHYESAMSILTPMISMIANDVSQTPVRHVNVNEFGRYHYTRTDSELNSRLEFLANIDQTGVDLIRDAAVTMMVYGSCALIGIDRSYPKGEPLSIRVGVVDEWYSNSVKLRVYNKAEGKRENIVVPKEDVAICYNPLHSVMNSSDSSIRRLANKIALLDLSDSKAVAPGLDLIIQMPVTMRKQKREDEAKRRMDTIYAQLSNVHHGVAYIGGDERVIQLNRSVDNTLPDRVKSLTSQVINQLGCSVSVFEGTASQEEILIYRARTVDPIISAITLALTTKFLTQTARTQGQRVMALPDKFKMVPLSELATAAQIMTNTAAMTSNELRAVLNLPQSKDPDADKLRNKNLSGQGENAAVSDSKEGVDKYDSNK